MPTCMFCPNRANSEEHLWPEWVHERRDFGPLKRRQANDSITVIPHPKVTVRAVCKTCNEGWMSLKLEVPNIPIVGSMMQGISLPLDRAQQQSVAVWCMKMAFLTDWQRSGGRHKRFYTRDEAVAFVADETIPQTTRIWIGHLTSSHLSNDGHEFELLRAGDMTRIGLSNVATIVVGHFVAQIVTDHINPGEYPDGHPDFASRAGPWETKLIEIWLIQKEWVTWPPRAHSRTAARKE